MIDCITSESYGTGSFAMVIVIELMSSLGGAACQDSATFVTDQEPTEGKVFRRTDFAGQQYKAWSQYQFNEPKDKYGNYTMKQYSEGYGFDLRKELDKYEIKELYQQASTEKLVSELQNGNRVAITAMGPDGEHKQLRLEAVPKYSNVNFSDKDGKPYKREDYLAPEQLEKGKDVEKGKDKEKSKESSAELSI